MKRKLMMALLVVSLAAGSMTGCGAAKEAEVAAEKAKEEEGDAAKAAEEAAAKEAEANDYYEKGRAALYGLDGTERNFESAHQNFEKAKELGKVEANFYLGVLNDWYAYPKKDYAAAMAYYEACGDNPYAKLSLGYLYWGGQGVEEDKEKAKELFQSVVDQGCADGYSGLASVSYDGEDYAAALEYYNKVVAEGTEQIYTAGAMVWIGWLYGNGYGVEQDYGKALEWFEKSAELGNASAMNEIGWLYRNGYGVDQDYGKALEWYGKAAELGNASAMNNIGWLYENGYGVDQDYGKALEWYGKAAELGNASAMNNIGWLYQNGEGVEQDYGKALEWYEKAAELGDATAIGNIGYLYYMGYGVEQDYGKALEWHEKAAELGDETAKENAEALRQKIK